MKRKKVQVWMDVKTRNRLKAAAAAAGLPFQEFMKVIADRYTRTDDQLRARIATHAATTGLPENVVVDSLKKALTPPADTIEAQPKRKG